MAGEILVRKVTILSCCVFLLNGLIGGATSAAPEVSAGRELTVGLTRVQMAALSTPNPTMIWLVVSSRPTFDQATAVAQSFAATLGPALITRSRNGPSLQELCSRTKPNPIYRL